MPKPMETLRSAEKKAGDAFRTAEKDFQAMESSEGGKKRTLLVVVGLVLVICIAFALI